MPQGLKWARIVLILLLIIGALSTVFMFFLVSLFPALLPGNYGWDSMLFSIFGLFIYAVIIYGMTKPGPKIYKAMAALLVIAIVAEIIYAAFSPFAQAADIVSFFVFYGLGTLADIALLWFVIKTKACFRNRRADIRALDKAGRKQLWLFVIFALLSLTAPGILSAANSFGSSFYQSVFFATFSNQTFQGSMRFCGSLGQPQRDDCLLSMALYYRNSSYANYTLCDLMQTRRNIWNCFAVFGKCDLLQNQAERSYCEYFEGIANLTRDQAGDGLGNVSGFQTFTSAEAGFSVLLPGTPTGKTQSAQGYYGDVLASTFQAQQNSTYYTVVRFHYSADFISMLSSPYALFDAFRDATLDDTAIYGSQLAGERNITLGLYPGKEFILKYMQGNETMMALQRVYLAGNDFYTLTAETYENQTAAPEITVFFSSFRLLR